MTNLPFKSTAVPNHILLLSMQLFVQYSVGFIIVVFLLKQLHFKGCFIVTNDLHLPVFVVRFALGEVMYELVAYTGFSSVIHSQLGLCHILMHMIGGQNVLGIDS